MNGSRGHRDVFNRHRKRFAGVVDGKHANGFGDVPGADRRCDVREVRVDLRQRRQGRYLRIRSPDGEARDVAGFDPSSGQGEQRPEGASRPDRATSTDHRPNLEGRGIDRRSVHGRAGKGQRLVTAVTLVGSPFVPYGTAQVIEVQSRRSPNGSRLQVREPDPLRGSRHIRSDPDSGPAGSGKERGSERSTFRR